MDLAAPAPASPDPAKIAWRERTLQRLRDPKKIGASLILGLLVFAAALYWKRTHRQAWQNHSETTQDVIELYKMQLRYKKAKGVYANDLDTLLSITPDAAARKARMAQHLDITTLAVVSNQKRFKIEANVLDSDRSLVKLEGPIPYFRTRKDVTLQQGPESISKDGAPIAPAPAPAPTPGR